MTCETKYEYAFVIGVWIFTLIVELMLSQLAHDPNTINNLSLVNIPKQISTIATSVYVAIILFIIVFFNLGKRLERDTKNLLVYGMKSVIVLLSAAFDLMHFLLMTPNFIFEVAGQAKFDLWTSIFLNVIIPFSCIIFIWTGRNQELRYRLNRFDY